MDTTSTASRNLSRLRCAQRLPAFSKPNVTFEPAFPKVAFNTVFRIGLARNGLVQPKFPISPNF